MEEYTGLADDWLQEEKESLVYNDALIVPIISKPKGHDNPIARYKSFLKNNYEITGIEMVTYLAEIDRFCTSRSLKAPQPDSSDMERWLDSLVRTEEISHERKPEVSKILDTYLDFLNLKKEPQSVHETDVTNIRSADPKDWDLLIAKPNQPIVSSQQFESNPTSLPRAMEQALKASKSAIYVEEKNLELLEEQVLKIPPVPSTKPSQLSKPKQIESSDEEVFKMITQQELVDVFPPVKETWINKIVNLSARIFGRS